MSVERAALSADGLLVQADLSVDTLGRTVRRVLGSEFSVPASLGRYLMARGGGRDTAASPDRAIRFTMREKEVTTGPGKQEDRSRSPSTA